MKILTTALYFILLQLCMGDDPQLEGPDNAEPIKSTEENPSNPPPNGICYLEEITCNAPGAKLTFDGGPDCYDCFCGNHLEVICCRPEPYPRVRTPRHCKLTLNPETCIYEPEGTCGCEILGYYYSDVSGYAVKPE